MSEIKELTDAVKAQGKKLDRIHNLLAGDPEYGTKGLTHKVEEHEDRIGKLEKGGRWTLWKVGGLSGATGGAIGAIAPKTVLSKISAFFVGLFT